MSDQRIVYILRSDRDPERHYVGSTSDVAMRLGFHNAGLHPYSAKHCPWRVLVTVEFPTEEKAVRFEKYLKSGSGRAFAKRHFG